MLDRISWRFQSREAVVGKKNQFVRQSDKYLKKQTGLMLRKKGQRERRHSLLDRQRQTHTRTALRRSSSAKPPQPSPNHPPTHIVVIILRERAADRQRSPYYRPQHAPPLISPCSICSVYVRCSPRVSVHVSVRVTVLVLRLQSLLHIHSQRKNVKKSFHPQI